MRKKERNGQHGRDVMVAPVVVEVLIPLLVLIPVTRPVVMLLLVMVGRD